VTAVESSAEGVAAEETGASLVADSVAAGVWLLAGAAADDVAGAEETAAE
jgi:hypothetical protein